MAITLQKAKGQASVSFQSSSKDNIIKVIYFAIKNVKTFRNFDVVSAAASSVLEFGKMHEIQHMHSYNIALPMLLELSPFLNMSPKTVYI